MNTTARVRRAVTALAVAAAAAVGLVFAAAPAHAALIPFKLRITAAHSGLSLTTAGFVGSAVYQDTYLGMPSQQWRLNFTAASVAQIVNEGSHLCMQPESTAASIVRVMPCDDPNDISHQSLQFWKDRQTMLNGKTVHRWQNTATGMYLDVSGASTSTGGLVIQFPFTGGTNQMFSQQIVP
jgi:Ricin-type beta-trefoil lectin domain